MKRLAACLALMSACGDDEPAQTTGGPPPGPEPYTLETVCEPFAARVCAAVGDCCGIAGLSFDAAGCRAAQGAACEDNVEGVRRGDLEFDPTGVDTCIEEIEHLYGTCAMPAPVYYYELIDLGMLCSDMFHGHLGVGEPCTSSVECAPSPGTFTFCDTTTDMVCESPRPRQAGESCGVGTGDFCVPNAYCDPNGTCQPHLELGAPCDPAYPVPCGLVRYCGATTLQCTLAKSGGDPCIDGVECASLSCDGTTCAPLPTIATAAICSLD